jgi:Tol biopolymer transport system component
VLVLTAVLAASLVPAGRAQLPVPPVGTLAYVTGQYSGKPVLWAASLDGTNKRVLAKGGQAPEVSPDGTRVAYLAGASHLTLRIIAAAGGTPQTIAANVWYADSIRWSPDGTKLAVITGPELGPYTLKLFDLVAGTNRALATGVFTGMSFAPSGEGLVWSRAAKDSYPLKADLYKADLVGGPVTPLTTDQNALSPVWGPKSIVYSRQHKPRKKNDAQKLDLYTIAADGTGLKRVTNVKPPFLLAGLTALGWSADGTRLLAEYGGQDTSEAWRVDPATGAATDITGKFDGLIGYALSADGSTVLARSGYFDDPKGDVVTLDYATGRKTVLATHAETPSWNR